MGLMEWLEEHPMAVGVGPNAGQFVSQAMDRRGAEKMQREKQAERQGEADAKAQKERKRNAVKAVAANDTQKNIAAWKNGAAHPYLDAMYKDFVGERGILDEWEFMEALDVGIAAGLKRDKWKQEGADKIKAQKKEGMGYIESARKRLASRGPGYMELTPAHLEGLGVTEEDMKKSTAYQPNLWGELPYKEKTFALALGGKPTGKTTSKYQIHKRRTEKGTEVAELWDMTTGKKEQKLGEGPLWKPQITKYRQLADTLIAIVPDPENPSGAKVIELATGNKYKRAVALAKSFPEWDMAVGIDAKAELVAQALKLVGKGGVDVSGGGVDEGLGVPSTADEWLKRRGY